LGNGDQEKYVEICMGGELLLEPREFWFWEDWSNMCRKIFVVRIHLCKVTVGNRGRQQITATNSLLRALYKYYKKIPS
jgi:hypothetical protein